MKSINYSLENEVDRIRSKSLKYVCAGILTGLTVISSSFFIKDDSLDKMKIISYQPVYSSRPFGLNDSVTLAGLGILVSFVAGGFSYADYHEAKLRKKYESTEEIPCYSKKRQLRYISQR